MGSLHLLHARWAAFVLLGTLAGPAATQSQAEAEDDGLLAAPFRLTIDGQPLSVPLGHLAPSFADWDGDGRLDLLVGQFLGGRLGIHLGLTGEGAPRFGPAVWFEAGGGPGTIPAG